MFIVDTFVKKKSNEKGNALYTYENVNFEAPLIQEVNCKISTFILYALWEKEANEKVYVLYI